MKIQDVEVRTGLDRATIRFYEKEQILLPQRADNGYRNYSEEDVELLLKIKLLRKLGVNLSTIKSLQQGSADLKTVLMQQIQVLEQQIQNDTIAKNVCVEMCDADVHYSTLDSEQYLQKLSLPLEKPEFRESVSNERHPVRRYIARDIDLLLLGALVHVLVIMVLRIRPYNDVFAFFITVLSYAIVLPAEALMLHIWGSTPGKWLMGIHLEDPNGGKLSITAAFTRVWHVVFAGLGMYLPVYSLWRLWKSYTAVSEGKGTYWDDEAEMHYADLTVLKILLASLAVFGSIMLNFFATQDASLPRYRTENLTMEKFVSNYRDYEETFQNDNTMILADDGTWTERTNTNVVIIQIGDGSHERKDFQYTYNENNGIKTLSFRDSWENIQMMPSLPDYCATALYTVVASRPGVSVKDLATLEELILTEFGMPMQEGGISSGEFQIADVTFTWEAELPEDEFVYLHDIGGAIIRPFGGNENQPIPYKLNFKITIG